MRQGDEVVAVAGDGQQSVCRRVIEHDRVRGSFRHHIAKKQDFVIGFDQDTRDHVRDVVIEEKTHAITALAPPSAAQSKDQFRRDDLRSRQDIRKSASA